MEFKVIADVENKLFNRREIQGEIHSDAAPKREEVLSLLSEKLKVAEENLKIRTIQPKFGSKVFLIVANIYDSETNKNLIEKQTKKEKELEEKRKKAIEESKAAEEKPAENSEPVGEKEIEKIPEQQTDKDEVIKENKVEEEKNE